MPEHLHHLFLLPLPDLPSEFLSTPFGQSLRPQIDQMFGRSANLPGTSSSIPAAVSPPASSRQGLTPQAAAAIQNAMMAGNRQGMSPLASSLLGSVAAQASSYNGNGTATPPQQSITSSTTSPLTFSTNLASFTSTLHSHAATFALFTSKSDIVTRQVQQVFEGIAQEEKRRRRSGQGDIAFVEVDVDMPSGKEVAEKYGVLDTPGYACFKGDQKVRSVGNRSASSETLNMTDFLFRLHNLARRHLPNSER